jgi:hypothetical protein
VAKLPDGKSSADGVRMLPPLLRGLVGKAIRVACLVDNDWELLTAPTEATEAGSTVCLQRKEIENFLIEPANFSRAAAAGGGGVFLQAVERGEEGEEWEGAGWEDV